jgi:6-pyruvoyltetrahydropterin/6-carboxytetrahydropterin synthase
MYTVCKGIDVRFAHQIRGHRGACISPHGHTWRLELGLKAEDLDREGFVVDFSLLGERVLVPCHRLLDHAAAWGRRAFEELEPDLEAMGRKLLAARREIHGPLATVEREARLDHPVHGARNAWPGGMKVAVFPFDPTSERLAEWLYRFAVATLEDERVKVAFARVYEALPPAAAWAEYRP